MSNSIYDLVPSDGVAVEPSADADAPLSRDGEETVREGNELAAARCIVDVDPQTGAEEVSADDEPTERPTV